MTKTDAGQDGKSRHQEDRYSRDREERERKAFERDPEAFRAVVREANRRAVYAHITTLLSLSRADDDPVIGLAYVAIRETSEPFWSFSGQIQPNETLGAIECLKLALMNVFTHRFDGRFYAEESGHGDTVEVDDDGTLAIKCGGDDEAEADREKAENANRLVRELAAISYEFYGKKLPQDIRESIAMIGVHAAAELERLKPDNYYRDEGE